MKVGECESKSRERERQLCELGHVTFSLFVHQAVAVAGSDTRCTCPEFLIHPSALGIIDFAVQRSEVLPDRNSQP
jgi:hypothetical protein